MKNFIQLLILSIFKKQQLQQEILLELQAQISLCQKLPTQLSLQETEQIVLRLAILQIIDGPIMFL